MLAQIPLDFMTRGRRQSRTRGGSGPQNHDIAQGEGCAEGREHTDAHTLPQIQEPPARGCTSPRQPPALGLQGAHRVRVPGAGPHLGCVPSSVGALWEGPRPQETPGLVGEEGADAGPEWRHSTLEEVCCPERTDGALTTQGTMAGGGPLGGDAVTSLRNRMSAPEKRGPRELPYPLRSYR